MGEAPRSLRGEEKGDGEKEERKGETLAVHREITMEDGRQKQKEYPRNHRSGFRAHMPKLPAEEENTEEVEQSLRDKYCRTIPFAEEPVERCEEEAQARLTPERWIDAVDRVKPRPC